MCFGSRSRIAYHSHLHPIITADGAAEDVFLLQGRQVAGWHDPLPDFAVEQLQKFFRCRMLELASLVDNNDLGRGGFHIRNDVRR